MRSVYDGNGFFTYRGSQTPGCGAGRSGSAGQDGNDESLWQHGNVTSPYSRFQLERYIAENSNDIYTDGQLRLIIELYGGEAAGAIDVFSFDPRHRRAELGIVVLEEFRRRGIGRVALSLMERYCFRFLGIHQLYAYIQKENTACLNLFILRAMIRREY